MPASDFEAVLLHNLGAIGRMVPVHDQAPVPGAGAGWSATIYTVPPGRILVLDAALILCYGGTVPTYAQLRLEDSGGVLQGRLARSTAVSVRNVPLDLVNPVWVESGWDLVAEITGGAADTDMMWSLSGRLFDWSDFGSP